MKKAEAPESTKLPSHLQLHKPLHFSFFAVFFNSNFTSTCPFTFISKSSFHVPEHSSWHKWWFEIKGLWITPISKQSKELRGIQRFTPNIERILSQRFDVFRSPYLYICNWIFLSHHVFFLSRCFKWWYFSSSNMHGILLNPSRWTSLRKFSWIRQGVFLGLWVTALYCCYIPQS